MSVKTRVESVRRDVAWMVARLTNRRPPPFTTSRPELRVIEGGLFAPRTLRIAEIVKETADAVSVTFEDPTGAPVRFRAGQFLTLVLDLEGETFRRAYSIASAAGIAPRVTIGVKRVVGGRVSGHLVERARVGDLVRVLGPSGTFGPRVGSGSASAGKPPRHLVLVGGGSGITPLMSILRTALSVEPAGRITLVYANRGPEAVMFSKTLDVLAAEEPTRFTLKHVFGETLTDDGARAALEAAGAFGEGEPEFYLCGPSPMMASARSAILARGVPAARIHEERFTAAPRAASTGRDAVGSSKAAAARVTFRVRGRTQEVEVTAEQTLLEAGLAAGLPMPFSCSMGGCGACKVHVSDGAVEMDEPSCLTDEERAAGEVLACVGRACGGRVTVEVRP